MSTPDPADIATTTGNLIVGTCSYERVAMARGSVHMCADYGSANVAPVHLLPSGE